MPNIIATSFPSWFPSSSLGTHLLAALAASARQRQARACKACVPKETLGTSVAGVGAVCNRDWRVPKRPFHCGCKPLPRGGWFQPSGWSEAKRFARESALFVLLSAPLAVHAATEQEGRNAILGKQSFTPEELAAMDFNGDGVVDVADMIIGNFDPADILASFAAPASQAIEGEAEASIQVNLVNGPYTGPLAYRLIDTQSGESASHTLQLTNAISAQIPITLAEDGEITDPRTYQLTLQDSSGYVLGASTLHTLIVYDDDAVWQGALFNGGIKIDFQLRISQTAGSVSAALVSDGNGIVPMVQEQTEWGASRATWSADGFEVVFDDLPIPADAVATQPTMTRTLRLWASPGELDPTRRGVIEAGMILGVMTENLTAPDAPWLNRLVDGAFVLVKESPYVIVPDAALADSN